MNNRFINTVIKLSSVFLLALVMVFTAAPVQVKASLDNPRVVANVYVNGVLTTLGDKTATTTVVLVADRPVMFYMGGESLSDGYSQSKEVKKGYGTFTFYVVDQQGRVSENISVKMDVNQPTILSGVPTQSGLTSVTINSMKPAYYIVNGVKSTTLEKTKTFTANGTYTIKAVTEDGLESNVVTFSIPTKGATVTTTRSTTKIPVKTTTKVPGSTPAKTTTTVAGNIALSLVNIVDGTMTNEDVTIKADQAVFFIVNGIKDTTAKKELTVNGEGTYTITAENTKKQTSNEVMFVIDKTAPVMGIEIGGVAQTPGLFKEPVTLKTDEQGVFYVNGVETFGTNNELVINEAGTYTVEFADLANNKTSVDFVIDRQPIEEPKSNDAGWILYMAIGVIAGAVIALAGSFLLNRRNKR